MYNWNITFWKTSGKIVSEHYDILMKIGGSTTLLLINDADGSTWWRGNLLCVWNGCWRLTIMFWQLYCFFPLYLRMTNQAGMMKMRLLWYDMHSKSLSLLDNFTYEHLCLLAKKCAKCWYHDGDNALYGGMSLSYMINTGVMALLSPFKPDCLNPLMLQHRS